MATAMDKTIELRNLRRGIADGRARGGQPASGEWLAARWEPYLNKRAETVNSLALRSEISAVLGHGTAPAWFRRQGISSEEREVLKNKLQELCAVPCDPQEAQEMAGSTNMLVADMHQKMFSRKVKATK